MNTVAADKNELSTRSGRNFSAISDHYPNILYNNRIFGIIFHLHQENQRESQRIIEETRIFGNLYLGNTTSFYVEEFYIMLAYTTETK